MDDIEDGWGDDDGIGEDEDLQEDGWGDDELDLGNDDDYDDDYDDESRLAAFGAAPIKEKDSISINDGGWDWEDDNDIKEGDASITCNFEHSNQIAANPLSPANGTVNPVVERATQGLVEYVKELGDIEMLDSLNEKLDANCNQPDAALQLCRYYHDRPNLKEYTLDAEISRMDYQVMISDEIVLTLADEIQHYFTVDHPVDNLVDDMLLRSSNQSLLADIFPIITGMGSGSGKLVRLEYLANAVATKCRFVLDMRQGGTRFLQVDCTLVVSIPSGMPAPAPSKLDIATLRLMIDFSPEPSGPYVKYQIVSIQSLINLSKDMERIRAAAEAVDPHQLEMADIGEAASPATNNEILRDHFIESLVSTQSGFKSAMQDLDSTLNVSNKLNYVKNISVAAATMLPSADDIMRAAASAELDVDVPIPAAATAVATTKQLQRPPPPAPPLPPRSTSREMSPETEKHNEISRPKPIIGGLLMSGISRLAKAATLPQEDETTPLYRNDADSLRTNQSSHSRSGMRAPTPPPPPPPPPLPLSLPQQSISTNMSTGASIINTSSASNCEKIPESSSSLCLESNLSLGDERSGDGWSDDDDLQIADDDEISSAKPVPPPMPGATTIATPNEVISTTDDAVAGEYAPVVTEGSKANIQGIHEGTDATRTTTSSDLYDHGQSFHNDTSQEQKQQTPAINTLGNKAKGKLELEREREYLLQKLKEIQETKSVLHAYTGVLDDCESIPPQKQFFVSRSEILNLRSVREQHFSR